VGVRYRVTWMGEALGISRKVVGSIPDGVSGFSNCAVPSSHTMTLGTIQPVIQMSNRYFLGSKEWSACKTVITAIITTACASTACRRDF
jgi:hypothetical protein